MRTKTIGIIKFKHISRVMDGYFPTGIADHCTVSLYIHVVFPILMHSIRHHWQINSQNKRNTDTDWQVKKNRGDCIWEIFPQSSLKFHLRAKLANEQCTTLYVQFRLHKWKCMTQFAHLSTSAHVMTWMVMLKSFVFSFCTSTNDAARRSITDWCSIMTENDQFKKKKKEVGIESHILNDYFIHVLILSILSYNAFVAVHRKCCFVRERWDTRVLGTARLKSVHHRRIIKKK